MQLSAVRPPAGLVTPSPRATRVPAPGNRVDPAPDSPPARRVVLRAPLDDILPAPVGALRSYLDELALGRS